MHIFRIPIRITLAAAGILAALLLTGCWDDAEINGRAFVLGFGADGGEGGYQFTFQLAIPVSGESDSSGSILYEARTVTGDTPAAAVRTLEKDLGRQINFEQLSLIVIGEDLSQRNFTGLTDYFFRRASVRRQSCIAVCAGSAGAFFGHSAAGRAISTEAASALQSYDAGGGIAMNLFSLYKALVNRDEFFLPRISAEGEGEGSQLAISGAAAYGREGEYRGEAGGEELELLRLTRGSGIGGSLSVKDGRGNLYCCEVRQSDCSVKCRINNGVPAFRIHLELVIIPLDTRGEGGGEYSDGRLRAISEEAGQSVRERLEALALRSRESLGSSVLGLQDIIRQRQPDWYGLHEKEWEKFFRKSEIEITVNCTVAGGGLTK